MDFASLFECGRGMLSVAQFISGSLPESQDRRRDALEDIEKFTMSRYPASFAEVIVCDDFDRSLPVFLQGHSLGPLKPNIIMFG